MAAMLQSCLLAVHRRRLQLGGRSARRGCRSGGLLAYTCLRQQAFGRLLPPPPHTAAAPQPAAALKHRATTPLGAAAELALRRTRCAALPPAVACCGSHQAALVTSAWLQTVWWPQRHLEKVPAHWVWSGRRPLHSSLTLLLLLLLLLLLHLTVPAQQQLCPPGCQMRAAAARPAMQNVVTHGCVMLNHCVLSLLPYLSCYFALDR